MSALEAVREDEGDDELVARARGGDVAATAALYERHLSRVRAVCVRRLSGLAVDDAVQEAFTRAFASLDALRDGDRFGAWVRGIAARVCVDEHRHRARVTVVQRHDEQRSSEPLPEDVAILHERQSGVLASLATLSDRDREMLWLRDALGYSVDDVAGHLGVTSGSARVLLTRARHRLRAAASGLAGWTPLWLRRWMGHVGEVVRQPAAVAAGVPAAVAGVAIGLSALFAPDAAVDAATPVATVLEQPRVAAADPETAGDRAPATAARHEERSVTGRGTSPPDRERPVPDGVDAGSASAGFEDEPPAEEPVAELEVFSGDQHRPLADVGVYVGSVIDGLSP